MEFGVIDKTHNIMEFALLFSRYSSLHINQTLAKSMILLHFFHTLSSETTKIIVFLLVFSQTEYTTTTLTTEWICKESHTNHIIYDVQHNIQSLVLNFLISSTTKLELNEKSSVERFGIAMKPCGAFFGWPCSVKRKEICGQPKLRKNFLNYSTLSGAWFGILTWQIMVHFFYLLPKWFWINWWKSLHVKTFHSSTFQICFFESKCYP